MSRSLKAHVLLVLVTMVWGGSFVLLKQALYDASPLLLNAIRMTVAALALGLAYRNHFARMDRAVLRFGALVGIFLWLGYELQTEGLRLTTPSKSGFLTGVSVILVPVFLHIFWGKWASRWTIAGVGTALAGLYLMTVPAGNGLLNLQSINQGDLLTICSAVVFAFQIIFVGRAMQKHPFEQVATVQIVFCAVLMLPTAYFAERPYILWTPRVIWAVLVTGLVGTAAAFTVQAWAQQFTPPTHTALIFMLEPVFAWVASYLALGEKLGMRAAAGAALILGGILMSELKGSAAEPATELPPEPSPATNSEI